MNQKTVREYAIILQKKAYNESYAAWSDLLGDELEVAINKVFRKISDYKKKNKLNEIDCDDVVEVVYDEG